jgi:hypothetical protein
VKACRFACPASVGILVVTLAACAQGGLANAATYSPPPPLALVAMLDPSSSSPSDEFHQLEDVIRAGATPGEAVVVMLMQPWTVLSG